MIRKHPLAADRIRCIPERFSWVDHRLVSDHHIDRIGLPAAALYLFLVTVSDARGLSYYSEPSLGKRLKMDRGRLIEARQELLAAGLIAYRKPLYQVLALDRCDFPPSSGRGRGQPQSIADIFSRLAHETGGGDD